jgi:hypothetical protein
MSIIVTQPFLIFYDRSGQPLDAGYIYIGTPGINPEVAPITVYWDSSLTTTAAQPIRTLAGYPSRNGSPSNIIASTSPYSILIKDKTGALVFSDLNFSAASALSGVGEIKTVDNYEALRGLTNLVDGAAYYMKGYYTDDDNGQGFFLWDAASTATPDAGAVVQLAIGGTGRFLRQFPEDGVITYEMWGAKKLTSLVDTHDSLAAINACHAFLPGFTSIPANWKTPRKVIVNGLYGVSDTVEFIGLFGITFSGLNTMAYESSGYRWLGTPDPTKYLCHAQANRSCTWEYLRGIADLTATKTTAMLGFWSLDGTITTSIQERCTWRYIMAGERDAYDRSAGLPNPTALPYQFRYMFRGTGNNTNNDFHTFEQLRCQSTEYPFYNNDSNFVDWVVRDSRFHFNDHVAFHGTNKITFQRCEGNNIHETMFVLGGGQANVIPDVVIDGWLSESCDGNFATLDTQGQLVIKNSGIDCCGDNVTFPFVFDIRGNNTALLVLDNVRTYNNATTIAAGAPSAAKTIILRDSNPLSLDLTGGGSAQRVYVERHYGAIRTGLGLTDTKYKPNAQLLSPTNDASLDDNRYDIPQGRTQLGNRFEGGGTSIRHVTYDSGTISSGADYTFTSAIPANCILLGVTVQNRSAFSVSYTVGVSGTLNKFGTKAAAQDPTPSSNSINDYTITSPEYSKAAQNVLLTATAGTFSSGRAFLTVHYITLEPRYINPDNAA